MEEWRTIKVYPKYEISNLGNIRNAKTKKIKPTYLRCNKLIVDLNRKLRLRNLSVARLVYNHFADKPAPSDCLVIIRDKNPTNCSFENLRLKINYDRKPTERAIEFFNREVYAIVKYYLIEIKGLYPNGKYWGGLEFDDAVQDCVFMIWQFLGLYEDNCKAKFSTWCIAILRKTYVANKYFKSMEDRIDGNILNGIY